MTSVYDDSFTDVKDSETEREQLLSNEFDIPFGTLYTCLSECYIYSTPGNDNGTPKMNGDILYDTIIGEIIDIDIEKRFENYVTCFRPVTGWIYLKLNDMDKNDLRKYNQFLRKKSSQSIQNGHSIGNMDDSKNSELSLSLNDMPSNKKLRSRARTRGKSFRRDFFNQKYSKLPDNVRVAESNKELNALQKCLNSKIILNLIFFFRRNPFIPGFIIKIIQGVVELLSLFDFLTDAFITFSLSDTSGVYRLFFAGSACILAAPWIIAWIVGIQVCYYYYYYYILYLSETIIYYIRVYINHSQKELNVKEDVMD